MLLNHLHDVGRSSDSVPLLALFLSALRYSPLLEMLERSSQTFLVRSSDLSSTVQKQRITQVILGKFLARYRCASVPDSHRIPLSPKSLYEVISAHVCAEVAL